MPFWLTSTICDIENLARLCHRNVLPKPLQDSMPHDQQTSLRRRSYLKFCHVIRMSFLRNTCTRYPLKVWPRRALIDMSPMPQTMSRRRTAISPPPNLQDVPDKGNFLRGRAADDVVPGKVASAVFHGIPAGAPAGPALCTDLRKSAAENRRRKQSICTRRHCLES